MSEELIKALMNTGTHSNLYQEDLSPLIYNLLLDELPLWSLMGTEQAQGPVHQYRVRASLPEAWVEGELSEANFQSATHTLRESHLKIVRSWGGVSGFMQKLSEKWVNALRESIETAVEGLANTVEFLALYGDRSADAYQPNGVFAEMLAHTTAKTALTSGGNIYDLNTALTLTHLDNMIDQAKAYRGGKGDRHVFLASRQMISRISGLQTRVNRDVQTVEYEGGFVMSSYRGIGLLPSDVVAPAATSTSPQVAAVAAAGGSLAADDYYYTISSVTLSGEQKPHTTIATAASATTNNTINLSWTADANAKLYYIWRSLSNDITTMKLLAVINAKTYDGNGNVNGNRTTFSDTGALTPNTAINPLDVGENVWLLNVDPGERGIKMLGAVSPLGDAIGNYFTYTPLAITNSAFKFMIEGFIAPKIPYPTSLVVARRAKLA